jgi:hypothetical protein
MPISPLPLPQGERGSFRSFDRASRKAADPATARFYESPIPAPQRPAATLRAPTGVGSAGSMGADKTHTNHEGARGRTPRDAAENQ